MRSIIDNVYIISAYESNISEREYYESMKNIILETQKYEPTIVLHSKEEIIDRMQYSIIALLNGKIIGNTSIYPTEMNPLDDVYFNGEKLKIGEYGSTITAPEFRGYGIGKKLVREGIKFYKPVYDLLVGATVNEIMYNLMKNSGFKEIPFPKEYYEEGKKYLSGKMEGGLEEFEDRAKCLMYFDKVTNQCREHILYLLKNQ